MMRAPEAGGQSATDANAEAPLTPEYIAAIDAHNQAMRKYRVAVDAYRAKQLSETEYLAARAERDAAHRAFDAAYDAAIAAAR